MLTNDQHYKFIGGGPRPQPSGLLARIFTTVASIAALVLVFMFSVVIFVSVAVIALAAGAYLWWKTRALRRQMRERPRAGHIIEGEVIRDVEQDPPRR